jgi:hypothetical protein
MIKRITEKDEEERMPYKHDPLTNEEILNFKKVDKARSRMGENIGRMFL